MQALLFLILRLALLICLLAFTGLIVWTMWREWRGGQASLIAESHPTLILLQPPDARSLRFRTLQVIIGRSQGCDAVIPDPTLSGRHARFSYHHQQWWLEDLQTTNGTFLNGQMVSEPVVITSGDAILCGRVRLEVVFEEPA
jgi:pSer/pThr/pTyr-binding forkhead associated (FHA) protein